MADKGRFDNPGEHEMRLGGGPKRLRIGIRKVQEGPVQGDEGPLGEAKRRGGTLGVALEDDDLVTVARKHIVEVFDLGMSLSVGPPHSYAEFPSYRIPVHVTVDENVTLITGPGPFFTEDADWVALDTLLLGANPTGYTNLPDSGRKAPHAKPLGPDELNPPSTLAQLALRRADNGNLVAFGGGPSYNWKWATKEIPDEVWAPAPEVGKYIAKTKFEWSGLSMADVRYWPFGLPSGLFKVTALPAFSAPAVALDMTHPLRLFFAPRLYWLTEQVVAHVRVPGSNGTGHARVWEEGLHFFARAPVEGVPTDAEAWMALHPSSAHKVMRVSVKQLGPFNPFGLPGIIESEEFNRRVSPLADVVAYAKALAASQVVSPNLGAAVIVSSSVLPLTAGGQGLRSGHLAAIIEYKTGVQYVWRA